LVPEIVTVVFTVPLVGLKLAIVGVGVTKKFSPVVTVCPPTVTEILPKVAPTGTVTVRLVGVDAVTTASTPLNFTVLFAGVAS